MFCYSAYLFTTIFNKLFGFLYQTNFFLLSAGENSHIFDGSSWIWRGYTYINQIKCEFGTITKPSNRENIELFSVSLGPALAMKAISRVISGFFYHLRAAQQATNTILVDFSLSNALAYEASIHRPTLAYTESCLCPPDECKATIHSLFITNLVST